MSSAPPRPAPTVCSPSSPTPTTSRWPAAARWRAWPTPARTSWSWCASHGERGAEPARSRRRARRVSAPSRCATRPRALGVPELIVCDHPDGDLRWAAGVRSFHAELVLFLRHHRPAPVITFGEDGLYWHRDHIGVYERVVTARCVTRHRTRRRSTIVTMPSGVMPEIVAVARRAAGRRRQRGSGASIPDVVRHCAQNADTITVDVRDRAAASSPPFRRIAARWATTTSVLAAVRRGRRAPLLGTEYLPRRGHPGSSRHRPGSSYARRHS